MIQLVYETSRPYFLFSKFFPVNQLGASGPFQEITSQLTKNTTLGLGVCLGEWLRGVLDLRKWPSHSTDNINWKFHGIYVSCLLG